MNSFGLFAGTTISNDVLFLIVLKALEFIKFLDGFICYESWELGRSFWR